MLRFPSVKPLLLTAVALLGVAFALSLALFSAQVTSAQPAPKRLVFFTAAWCAACREVLPVLERLSEEQHIVFVSINVEEGNAPKQASSAGLQIPQKELPQIYLLEANKSKLLFDGSNYRMGEQEALEVSLKEQLAL